MLGAGDKIVSLRIVLLGGPGAGKGTQAVRISAALDVPHISTGDIFRGHLSENTELGRQIKPFMEQGSLVPDELTCEVVATRLGEADCAQGYVLDGFPRSVPQAEMLAEMLANRGEQIDMVVDLAVPDDEIVERLSARRTCPKCGTIYNLKFKPPSGDPTKCDRPNCGGTLVQRADDQEETIRHRLEVYHRVTEPLCRFYREKGTLRTIDGAGQTPDTVFEKIEEQLDAEGVR